MIKIAAKFNLISWESWFFPSDPLAFSMLNQMPMSKSSPHSLLLYATGLQYSLNRNSTPSYKFTIQALGKPGQDKNFTNTTSSQYICMCLATFYLQLKTKARCSWLGKLLENNMNFAKFFPTRNLYCSYSS